MITCDLCLEKMDDYTGVRPFLPEIKEVCLDCGKIQDDIQMVISIKHRQLMDSEITQELKKKFPKAKFTEDDR